MAQNTKKTKAKGREEKKGLKVGSFFGGIKQELKRVTWPDRPTLKKNTVTVLAIILSAALIIFVFDHIVQFILDKAGFYRTHEALPPSRPTASRELGEAASKARVDRLNGVVHLSVSELGLGSEVL